MESDMENGADTKSTKSQSWLARLQQDVTLTHADIPILACCSVSGICDSVAFSGANVFVSMQTGNTLFLALGTAGIPADEPKLWIKCLASMASFWLGCFVFSRISRLLGPLRKSSLALLFLMQGSLICVAAALAQTNTAPTFGQTFVGTDRATSIHGLEDDMFVCLPIALLAFQFGGQIVVSRALGFNEVPTTVLTSVYCDLFSDPKILAPLGENVKRNRRAAAVVLFICGGIVGGHLQRSAGGMSAALWLGCGIKLVIGLAWLLWKGKEVSNEKK
ncbi:hypothetical protein MCOR25_010323 [Pyricularia grisea]|uniref:DUF1275 domain protein n=1 Tax=Pyricularia grisea TaxID=148305 RepID=A0A6P8B4C9_PYRGI|nr:hypothetical protein PgNI_05389 [Pyricularia grisea]KAI6350870.1 hypothetical protein MCOR25_010323 [Pyricularia grisea]TLD10186.1 hypothetical protein PgNI_05389 [Pyricularia grisea]